MPATGFNRFKPGKIEFMPVSGINAFNFSRFKPLANPDLTSDLISDLASDLCYSGQSPSSRPGAVLTPDLTSHLTPDLTRNLTSDLCYSGQSPSSRSGAFHTVPAPVCAAAAAELRGAGPAAGRPGRPAPGTERWTQPAVLYIRGTENDGCALLAMWSSME